MTGKPSAMKRGRDPALPYIPVIEYADPAHAHGVRTERLPGHTFATREEAVAHADRVLKAGAARLRGADARYRAMRERFGT